jgi:hypothetical protein
MDIYNKDTKKEKTLAREVPKDDDTEEVADAELQAFENKPDSDTSSVSKKDVKQI